jgi:hypothetical protein
VYAIGSINASWNFLRSQVLTFSTLAWRHTRLAQKCPRAGLNLPAFSFRVCSQSRLPLQIQLTRILMVGALIYQCAIGRLG